MSDQNSNQPEMINLGPKISIDQRNQADRDSVDGFKSDGRQVPGYQTLEQVNAQRKSEGLSPLPDKSGPKNPFDITPQTNPNSFNLPNMSPQADSTVRGALVAGKFDQETASSLLNQIEKNEYMLSQMPKDRKEVFVNEQKEQLTKVWGGEVNFKNNMNKIKNYLGFLEQRQAGSAKIFLETQGAWTSVTTNYLLNHVNQLERQYKVDFIKSTDEQIKQAGL